jgi:putative ATPase
MSNPIPLPERMRPRALSEVVGQEHLLGPKGGLTRLTSGGRLPSMVMWGPPGTGKTTLARILAEGTGHGFLEFSGVTGSAAELKKFLLESREMPLFRAVPPVIFLDEIHRFNRAQQDILLPFLERGEAVLIGATTENPAFYLNPALRSRCQLIGLKGLEPSHIISVLQRAWSLERPNQAEPKEVFDWLAHWAGGDLRAALSGLETYFNMADADLETIQSALGGRLMFDRADGHYDLASAFQKSLRGSDANAALYYLSRMIRGGEDPRFIARRLMVTAAEDVGNSDPQAFLLSEAASRAVEQIGWPEARIPLAQAVIYVANAPKSNATILGIDAALAADDAPIPDALRDSHTGTSKKIGRGVGYHYSHNDYDQSQSFLPERLRGEHFFEPARPQERSWRDTEEPNAAGLENLFEAWAKASPDGGELPLEAWATELNCSREALARSLTKLTQGRFQLKRHLVAISLSERL